MSAAGGFCSVRDFVEPIFVGNLIPFYRSIFQRFFRKIYPYNHFCIAPVWPSSVSFILTYIKNPFSILEF